MDADKLRNDILARVSAFYEAQWPTREFIPGETPIPVSGRVFDAEDLVLLVDASLDFWLTSGRYANTFEKNLASFLGVRHAILCNSGSSANLLAISSLTSEKLEKRCLKPGDEVITVASGFPTTVNPIFQNGLIPVFLDIDLETYNVRVEDLEDALSPRTRAVFLAHTLGNPFNLDAVQEFVRRHDLWLLEDNCDALGSTYRERYTGSFGDISTASFYPAHHITMGEGGCVLTSSPILKLIIESFRDWGRDCWCDPGHDNTCGKRFDWQLGKLPYGYDHKYIYSHIGYNLKITDLQAAVGVSQLKKLPVFISSRKQNWQTLFNGLKSLEEFFILPKRTLNSDPSWFGFLLTIRENAPFNRTDIVQYLESKKIATRQLFGGNLVKQPAYKSQNYRIAGTLKNTDIVMNQSFWIGVYPGLTSEMLKYVIEVITNYCKGA